MLSRWDLRWVYRSFNLSSALHLFPVMFEPSLIPGGKMECGEISMGKGIGFKFHQLIFTCQMLFISSRTLQYTSAETEFDWDFVPIMLIFTGGFWTMNSMAHTMFKSCWGLTVKMYNEILKLRGN